MSGEQLTCADCPLLYGDPGWCDTHIPDDVWAEIAPDGGVLCITCIARRLEAHGYSCINPVPLMVTSGPFIHMPQRPYNIGLPLTRHQRAVYEFVASYIVENGYAPSFEEIAAHFGYRSLATVHEHLESLRYKGWITREYNMARGITLLESAA